MVWAPGAKKLEMSVPDDRERYVGSLRTTSQTVVQNAEASGQRYCTRLSTVRSAAVQTLQTPQKRLRRDVVIRLEEKKITHRLRT